MSRKLSNFLQAYEKFTENSEAPLHYHIWTGIWMLAAAVRRKVWYEKGHNILYPNLYILFISPPGKGRKSSAANIGIKLLKELSDVKFSSESVTREALIKDIVGSQDFYTNPKGEPLSHCSLSIYSSEWSVFIGDKNSGNGPMIALLTDLFDCPDDWTYRTKLSGTDGLKNVFLNKLACTTFDYLAGSLPMDAIGGGLTSRIICVVEFNRRFKNAMPELTEEQLILRELIKQDLEEVSMMQGLMELTDEAKIFYKTWYDEQDDENPTIKDERFFGYLARKPDHIIKVAMLLSIAEGESYKIGLEHLTYAIKLFTSTEVNMTQAFGARGRNASAIDLERILEQIVILYKGHPGLPIQKRIIARQNYRQCDKATLQSVLEQLEEMGEIKLAYVGGEWLITYIGEFAT